MLCDESTQQLRLNRSVLPVLCTQHACTHYALHTHESNPGTAPAGLPLDATGSLFLLVSGWQGG